MAFALCPHCRSMQRGSALRCWKCGVDLTNPQDAMAGGGAAVLASAPAAVAAPLAVGDEPGPAPWGFLRRTFDPRIAEAELARAARFGSLLPWIETYRKLAALSLLGPMLIFFLVRSAMAYLSSFAYYPPGATAESMELYQALTMISFLLFWANIPVLYLAWTMYQGSEAAIWGGMVVWLVAIGLPVGLTVWTGTFNLVVFVVALAVLYLPMVLLWKTARVHAARVEFVRRDFERLLH